MGRRDAADSFEWDAVDMWHTDHAPEPQDKGAAAMSALVCGYTVGVISALLAVALWAALRMAGRRQ